MDFVGTWKVQDQGNMVEFLREIGAPEMVVKMGATKTEQVIEKNDNEFTITIKTPAGNKVNTLTLGEECEVWGVDGSKMKGIITVEDGKLVTRTERLTCVCEIQGDEMVETYTAGSATSVCRSKRV